MRLAAVPAHNILCPHQRLVINYATAATLTITADAVVLADASGRLKRFNALSETLTISSTGANGRDIVDNAGAEQASVWYHLFAIGRTDGTLDVFASQVGFPGSGTSIYTRLPSGYTWAGYLGAARNDGSSNFVQFQQRGDEVARDEGIALFGGTATAYTSIDLSSLVPPTARAVSGYAYALSTSGTGAGNFTLRAGATNNVGAISWFAPVTSTGNGVGGPYQIALPVAQTLHYYKAGNIGVYLNVSGWGF
jgi:hypothetical protein